MKNRQKLLELAIVIAVVASAVVWFQGDPIVQERQSARSPVVYATAMFDAGAPPAERPKETLSLWEAQYDAAQVALGQGDNKKAEALLLDALRNAQPFDEEGLHETLDDLGLVCFRQGDYQRSADFQARAIKAAQALKRPDRAATVGLYETRHALALAALDQRSEALAALDRARLAYIEAYPAGSPAYADALKDLAAQHRSLSDNEGAAKLLEE